MTNSLVAQYVRADADFAALDASNPDIHPYLRVGAAMTATRLYREADALDKAARKAARRAKVRAFFSRS